MRWNIASVPDMSMIELLTDDGEILLRPTKIICMLRNYAAHARELSNEVPGKPMFFLKPPSSLTGEEGNIVIPDDIGNLHHEVELALVIGRPGKNIGEPEATDHIKGYVLALDITARDIQEEARKKGLPWTEAKGYDTFAPVGKRMVLADRYDYRGKRIWLKVNGDLRQDGNTDLMIFSPTRIISSVSKVMRLEEDDIIMTGTPSGVGRIEAGDMVEAGIEGICDLKMKVIHEKE